MSSKENKPKKVLVVDDADFIYMSIKSILPTIYEVVGWAKNGEEAVESYEHLIVEGNKPDIIIMDLFMPIKDGMSAIEEIMALDPNVSILSISGLDEPQIISKAMKIGSKGYLCKPFTREQLISALEKMNS